MGKRQAIKHRPLKYLSTFHNDRWTHPNRAIVAGYGGGKTYAVCVEALLASDLNRGVPNMIVEPTYKMVADILIPTLTMIIEKNGIRYHHNKSSNNFYFPDWNGHIWLRSGDDPKKLKGPNMGMVFIDEPFIQSRETYDVAISRTRHPDAKILGVVLSGTPENLNWGYELITDDKEKFRIYQGTTFDNTYLPGSYVERLLTSYSEKDADTYVRGLFVDRSTGTCYHAFGPHNVIPSYTPVFARPIEISCDFNIGLMCWNLGQELNGIDYTFDYVEMTGMAKTETMCSLLKNKLESEYQKSYSGELIFYCDIAGSANRPEASRSNIEIIRDAFPNARIEMRHIMNIGDRIAATNGRLKDARGNVKAFVTEKCVRLIKDYKQVKWDHFFKKGTAGDLTHTSDGESYKFYAKYPLIGKMEITRRNIR